MDVYEAYSRILRGEPIELLNLSDRQQEIIEKFRRYEAREMCHAAISAKTGLCTSTIQDLKRVYHNLKNGEQLVMSYGIRKSVPINEEGSQTISEGIA
jgi:arginine deiminase